VRILFTGASSFTGAWFVRELVASGHEVTAVFTRGADGYPDPVRRERVELVSRSCRPVHGLHFGDERFLELAREGWDLLAHHAADVTDYKSPAFDVVGALGRNTRNLAGVLEALRAGGCRRVLLTGSVFEGGEGAGSQGLPDFSPYGLSKALTAQAFRFWCARTELGLGKLVIPNPFGPLEEPRFTAYLMRSWLSGQTPGCSSPAYVRDNIHVSLLAKVYARFAAELPEAGFVRLNPSGYVESQGAFARRVAAEMSTRLGRDCPVELATQTEFPEPRVRINTDVPDLARLGWSEAQAWDEMARWYLERGGR
jgi:nucleoside-diphosphate-sugar epimerase